MPKILTEVFIRNLQPAPKGQRLAIADAIVPGLKVRVTDKGAKTFVLWRRYPGGGRTSPSARALGRVGELTLAQARDKARQWLELIKQGKDPSETDRAAREAEAARRALKFSAVLGDYLTLHVKGQRKADAVEREMKFDLLPKWGHKPLADITRKDVIAVVNAVKARGTTRQPHNVFGHIKTFFNWAIEQGLLEHSPADHINPKRLIGEKAIRTRVLDDDELRAFWEASGTFGYPYQQHYRLLLLTGQRHGEVAQAHWREFDLDKKLWVIPPERFKSDVTHTVPLTDDALKVLDELPRWPSGALFSTFGKKPINTFSKQKAQLDERMAQQLALAEPPKKLPPFVIHDLRRTVRTRLSSLRVPSEVAEMVIGHGAKGIQRVYDRHRYVDEMREALTKWATLLRTIVTPPDTSNVVKMHHKAGG